MILAALALSGCGASIAGEIETVPLPPSLTTACAAPVPLPERALTDQEVEVMWGRDRSALRACGSRHGALVEASK